MYLIKLDQSVHVIRRSADVTLCGVAIPRQSMLVEPFRCEITCPYCAQQVHKETVETIPVAPQLREQLLQRFGDLQR